jgi:hypothetical protein
MAKQLQTVIENNFIQGLITEATGMNFPEKAVVETYNVRYNKKGTVNRRLGINHEAGYTSAGDVPTGAVSRSYVWNGVGFEGRRTFLVTQSGTMLNFFEAQTGGVYSTGLKAFDIDLEDYSSGVASITIGDKPASFAYGLGKLFVCHPYCDPFYVAYDDATDTIEVTQITVTSDQPGLPAQVQPVEPGLVGPYHQDRQLELRHPDVRLQPLRQGLPEQLRCLVVLQGRQR